MRDPEQAFKTGRHQAPHPSQIMEGRTVTILLISGMCTLSFCIPRQYHYINVRKNWTNAQSYCRQTYTDLVTVGSTYVMNKLIQTVGGNVSPDNFWIGLYDDYHSWKWSMSYLDVDALGYTGYRNWYPQQPFEGSQVCILMYVTSQFAQWDCNAQLPLVCSMGTAFVFIPASMSWTAAQSYCRQYYTDLAIVKNSADNYVVNHMMPFGVDRVWIGLYRELFMFWSAGSVSLFRNWYQGQPNIVEQVDNCAAASVSKGGQWGSFFCGSNFTFVCHKDFPVKQRWLKMKLIPRDSNVNFYDPAVTEAILQQLNQRLKAMGVTEYFTLTWRKQPDGNVFHQDEVKTAL